MTDIRNDIIDALSMYSSETLIPTYLQEQPEYRNACRTAGSKYDALQEILSPEGQNVLQGFKSASGQACWIELEANFRAGLIIGMNLARM